MIRPLFCLILSLVMLPWLSRSPGVVPSVYELTIGQSVAGRPITAIKIGDGPRKFVLVGDAHGGPEANTYELARRLADHFRSNPDEVPASVRLYIIPTLNPDGLALGTRFNASGVDLNRNMNTNLDTCGENDWTIHVQGAYGIESDTGGPYVESEPESRLIRDFLLDASGAIFYHTSGGDVFPAFCEHAPSIALAKIYAAVTGYRYDRYWPNYMITGGMHDWASSIGIAAITPELFDGVNLDFEQNLAGVRVVLAQAEELLPLPENREEHGFLMPALIWRYWKAYGGLDRFGPPLAPPEQAGEITRQIFERAILEIHPKRADRSDLVQLAPLGRAAVAGRSFPPSVGRPGGRYITENGYSLREAFLIYWERNDGRLLLGDPLSEEFDGLAADGQQRAIQFFERAVLAYYPEDNSVRLEPLGWARLVRDRIQTSPLAKSIR